MSNPNIVNSTLEVHPYGAAASAENDLNLPEGKCIAELLDDQKEKSPEDNEEKQDPKVSEK